MSKRSLSRRITSGLHVRVVSYVARVVCVLGSVSAAYADGFGRYRFVEQFPLPAGAGPVAALSDGRLITLIHVDLYVESSIDSRSFTFVGTLPDADVASFGAAFLRVSPDGTRIAVGNNGGASFVNLEVGVFTFPALTGAWFAAPHFDGIWVDNTYLALTAGEFGFPSRVTLLDTTSIDPTNPVNPIILDNIGGASGGVAIDAMGNLFTGNGFSISGPSGTGLIKAFTSSDWMTAATESPLDFEIDGVEIVDVLSASPLAFDAAGNLIVGGGDLSADGQSDYVAVVSAPAIEVAMAGGRRVDANNPIHVQRLDPDDENDGNFYGIALYDARRQLYLYDLGSLETYVFADRFGVSPFATRVVSYDPAPGQFVNNLAFNDPGSALGPPSGGGLFAADNESVVTLGGFGGSITLAFDHTVEDGPLNPLGLDAIVFGNAFWIGADGQTHQAECGVIEIAVDENGNGEADDQWYLIPGSHLSAKKPNRHVQTWDDDTDDAKYPPSLENWVPPGRTGEWTTESYLLPPKVFGELIVRNPSYPMLTEGIWAYADYAPTLLLGDTDGDNVVDDEGISEDAFYTVPDDPFTVGIDMRSGGGDAFDIAWAVDAATGMPAYLPGFDFIRISNAVNVLLGPFGEVSPEIDAVSDVVADSTGDADRDEDIDLRDAAVLQMCMGINAGGAVLCDRLLPADVSIVGFDAAVLLFDRMTGPRWE